MKLGAFLLLLACTAGAVLAGPLSLQSVGLEKCVEHCNTSHNFDHLPEHVYSYSYSSENRFAGGDPMHKVEAEMKIGVIEKCLWKITVSKATVIKGGTRDHEVEESLKSHSMMVNYDDGLIYRVCNEKKDTEPSVNIKVAMLSAIQNSMVSLEKEHVTEDEADISGICRTSYIPKHSTHDNVILIERTKDLRTCRHRQEIQTGIYSQQYSSPYSHLQNIPILSEETQKCNQTVKDKIMQRSRCEERSVLKPFKPGSDNAESISVVEVKLINDEERHTPSDISIYSKPRQPLMWHSKLSSSKSNDEVKQILRDICRLSKEILSPILPTYFHRLIHLLRKISDSQFIANYQNDHYCPESRKARDILLDALPAVGTPIAMKVMVEKIGNVTPSLKRMWATSLAFVPHVSEDALVAVKPLMRVSNVLQKYEVLGITSMAHKYIDQNGPDSEAISDIISMLKDGLGENCQYSDHLSEQQVIIALKGFGNLGALGDAKDEVMECMKNKANPIHIRMEALRSLRRMPCYDEVQESVRKLFETVDEDIEVRMESYLKIVRCPSYSSLSALVREIENEKNHQVKTFVSTHIINLNQSSDPAHKEVRKILHQIPELKFRPPHGMKHHSENLEWSLFSERYNLGFSVDKNVYYNDMSVIPRSLMVNLTADLFGTSLNVLEFGGRVQHLELYLKKNFGPDSPFANSTIGTLSKYIIEFLMSERNGSNSLFERHSSSDPKEESLISGYANFFGSELITNQKKNIEHQNIDQMLSFLEALQKTTHGKDVEVARSVMFLDTSIIFSTVTGQQLSIGVNGTAMFGLQSTGVFDISDILKGNVNINGTLIPSTAIQIDAVWKLKDVDIGMKIKTTLSNSLDIGGHIIVQEGRVLKLKVNLPQEKNELFNFKTEFFAITEQLEIPAEFPNARVLHNFCPLGRTLSQYLGVKACLRSNVHRHLLGSDYFLNGPVEIQVDITKDDILMRGFELELVVPTNIQHNNQFKVFYDTPGSIRARKILIDLHQRKISEKEHYLRIEVESQLKNFTLKGIYKNEPKRTKLEATVLVDRHTNVTLEANVDIDKTDKKTEYTSELRLRSIDFEKDIEIDGHAILLNNTKYQFRYNLKSQHPEHFPFLLKGSFIREGSALKLDNEWRISTDHSLELKNVNISYHGISSRRPNDLRTNSAIRYKFLRTAVQSFEWTTKVDDTVTSNYKRVNVFSELESTQFPELSSKLFWNFFSEPTKSYNNNIAIERRNVAGEYVNVINGSVDVSKQRSNTTARYTTVVKYRSGKDTFEKAAQVEFDISHQDHTSLNMKSQLQLYPDQEPMNAAFTILKQSLPKTKLDVKVDLTYAKKHITFKDQLIQRSEHSYEGKSELTWGSNQKTVLDYTYSKEGSNHHIKTKLTTHSNKILEHSTTLKLEKDTVEIRTEVNTVSKKKYTVNGRLSKRAPNYLDIRSPDTQTKLHVELLEKTKSINLLVDLSKLYKSKYNANILYFIDTARKSSIKTTITRTSEEKSEDRLELTVNLERFKESWGKYYYNYNLKGLYNTLTIEGSGKLSDSTLLGPHTLNAQARGSDHRRRHLSIVHNLKDDQKEMSVKYEKDGVVILDFKNQLQVDIQKPRLDVKYSLSVVSTNEVINNLRIGVNHFQHLSNSKQEIRNRIVFVSPKGTQHSLEGSFEKESEIFEGSLKMETPIPNWKYQDIIVKGNVSPQKADIKATIKTSTVDRATVSISMERNRRSLKVNVEIHTSIETLKSGKASFEYQQERQQTYFKADLTRNSVPLVSSDLKIHFDDSQKPKLDLEVKSNLYVQDQLKSELYLKLNNRNRRSVYEAKVTNDAKEIIHAKLEHEKEETSTTDEFKISLDKESVLDVQIRQKRDATNAPLLEVVTRSKLLSKYEINFKLTKDPTVFHPELEICSVTTTKCYSFELGYVNKDGSRSFETHRELVIKVKGFSSKDTTLFFKFDKDPKEIQSKLRIHLGDKALSYDLKVSYDTKDMEGMLDISLPSSHEYAARQILVRGKKKTVDKETKISLSIWPDQRKQRVIYVSTVHVRTDTRLQSEITLEHPDLPRKLKALVYYENDPSKMPIPDHYKLELDVFKEQEDKITIEAKKEYKNMDRHNMTLSLDVYKMEQQRLKAHVSTHLASKDIKSSIGLQWEVKLKDESSKSGLSMLEIDTHESSVNIYHQHPSVYLSVMSKTNSSRHRLDTITAESDLVINEKHFKVNSVFNLKDKYTNMVINGDDLKQIKIHTKLVTSRNVFKIETNIKQDNINKLDVTFKVASNAETFLSLETEFDSEEWEKIGAKLVVHWNKFVDKLKTKVDDVKRTIEEKYRQLRSNIKEHIVDPLRKEIKNYLDEVKDYISRHLPWLNAKMEELREKIKNKLEELKIDLKLRVEKIKRIWNDFIKTVKKLIPESVVEQLTDIYEKISSFIKWLKNLPDQLKIRLEQLKLDLGKIISKVRELVQSIPSAFSRIIITIDELRNDIREWIRHNELYGYLRDFVRTIENWIEDIMLPVKRSSTYTNVKRLLLQFEHFIQKKLLAFRQRMEVLEKNLVAQLNEMEDIVELIDAYKEIKREAMEILRRIGIINFWKSIDDRPLKRLYDMLLRTNGLSVIHSSEKGTFNVFLKRPNILREAWDASKWKNSIPNNSFKNMTD